MRQIIIKITKWLTLILSWLTISPLFIYLASKWQMIGKKVRILLLLISPFMLIVYSIIPLFIRKGYIDYKRKYYFADNEVIERITGVAFPKFELIDYKQGDVNFPGNYKDRLILEIKDDLSESTYYYLDSIINCNTTRWSKCDNEYSYEIWWGNGLSAPQGESEEEGKMLSLSFKKGSKIVTLHSGSW